MWSHGSQPASGWVLNTVGSKIIRTLEIIYVKKLIPNVDLWKNISQVIIFMLYTVYKKDEMIKFGNKSFEKSQILYYYAH